MACLFLAGLYLAEVGMQSDMQHLEVVKLGAHALTNQLMCMGEVDQLRHMSNVDKAHIKECELAYFKGYELA